MNRIDINVDIAEGFPWDAELVKAATSANVCCGVHAGSAELARETIELCRQAGTRIGLHPGYPDRSGMGRVSAADLGLTKDEMLRSIWGQCENLLSFASYIKPHGAFYHDSALDALAQDALTTVLERCGLPLMGLADSGHVVAADRAGVPLIREGFADRRYDGSGHLVSRSEPDAVLHDTEQIERQVVALAGRIDSICVHGDGSDPVGVVFAVRRALEREGIEAGW